MHKRSPLKLRSGTKGNSVQLTADKKDKAKQRERLYSTSSPHGSTTMPADTKQTVDYNLVERHVNTYLTSEDVISKISDRLSQEMKKTVETAVHAALSSLQVEVNKLRDEVKSLTEKLSQLESSTADKTDDLEQYQRRNNLRLFGLEETVTEDTDEIVRKVCRDQLGIELPNYAICRSHRVGRQPQPATDGRKRHRPIIVRFTSYKHRQLMFSAKKKLKGTSVTIHEDLTARRMEVYRAAATTHGPRNTWTLDGRVLWVDRDGNKGMATRLVDL